MFCAVGRIWTHAILSGKLPSEYKIPNAAAHDITYLWEVSELWNSNAIAENSSKVLVRARFHQTLMWSVFDSLLIQSTCEEQWNL